MPKLLGMLVEILGSPVGDATFASLHGQKRLEKIRLLLDRISSLANPQAELVLLRAVAGFPKINNGIRTCDSRFYADTIAECDRLIDQALDPSNRR